MNELNVTLKYSHERNERTKEGRKEWRGDMRHIENKSHNGTHSKLHQ